MTMYMCGGIINTLYTIDLTDGIATRVGSANQWGVSESSPRDLAWDGETLFMVGAKALYTVDRMTGIATRVGDATNFGISGRSLSPAGLTWDGSSLFMVSRDSLYTVDRTTGVATRVGELRWRAGFFTENSPAAIEWNGTVMYHLSNRLDRLFIVDRTSGALTPVGSSTDFGVSERSPQAMAWNGEAMFMTGTTLDALLNIDLITGRATRIGTATEYGVSERFATGFAWQVELAPPAPIIPPEPQFDGYEEFTDLYDIGRTTGGTTTLVAEEVEMLIESGVESLFSSVSTFTFQEALTLHTLTPRFPVVGVEVGDRIALSAGGASYLVLGFTRVGSIYRQQIIAQESS